MTFTLVSTVFNEAKRLDQTIEDIKNQTLQPSEIIITDAGSNDGTYQMLLKWKETSDIPIFILQKKGCNVASGRNMAIRAAKFGLIASMDFGCRFHPNWLESLILPFSNPEVSVVGGATTVEEANQQTMAAKADYILSGGYRVNASPKNFIPSSRSIAYKKEVFDNVGGYPEWLTLAGDDMVFGRTMIAMGYKIHYVDKPFAIWSRHTNLRGFVKEANRYGLGNGEAKIDYSNFKLYLISIILRLFFFLNAAFLVLETAFNKNFLFESILFACILLPAFRPYLSYFKNWINLKSEKYNFFVLIYGFYFFEMIRIGYVKGYVKGYFFSSNVQKTNAELLRMSLTES